MEGALPLETSDTEACGGSGSTKPSRDDEPPPSGAGVGNLPRASADAAPPTTADGDRGTPARVSALSWSVPKTSYKAVAAV